MDLVAVLVGWLVRSEARQAGRWLRMVARRDQNITRDALGQRHSRYKQWNGPITFKHSICFGSRHLGAEFDAQAQFRNVLHPLCSVFTLVEG